MFPAGGFSRWPNVSGQPSSHERHVQADHDAGGA